MKNCKTKITLVIIFLTFFAGIFGAGEYFKINEAQAAGFTYYESFEDKTVDTAYPVPPGGNCSNYLYDSKNAPSANCWNGIRDDFPARYGRQYLDMTCDWVNCEDPEYQQSQRAHVVYGRPSGWSPCNEWKANDGTEYWLAWSNYIPADYYEEYHSHMIMEFISGVNKTVVFAIYYGGDEEHGKTSYTLRQWYDGSTKSGISLGGPWAADKGTWIDWTLKVRWYSSSNPNALIELYRNGDLVWQKAGGTNYPSTDAPPILAFVEYNTLNYDGYTLAEREAFIRACDLGDAPTPWRRVPIDEIKITENSIGAKGYCDVAQPIWSKKPAISYPANGAANIPASFTAAYGGYADFRDDPQGCFAYTKTQVQVDEKGGDWSSLVYDSGEINSQTNNSISGLIPKQYQMRVRHKSLRQGTGDTYWGEWSDTRFFTVAGGNPDTTAPSVPGGFMVR